MTRWVAMVQKEVGERLRRRSPGRRPTASRRCSRSSRATCACCAASRARVFHPVPNVDSVLVVLRAPRARRRRPSCARSSRRAFAHRRKALARLAGARPGAATGVRDRARAALEALGHPGRRARRAPVARGLPRAVRRRSAHEAGRRARPAKINVCLFLGPRRAPTAATSSSSVMQSLALADERDARAAPTARGDEVVCPGVEGAEPRRRRARARSARRPAGTAPPRAHRRSTSASRSPPGMAGGSADAAAALRLLAARAAASATPTLLHDSPPSSAPTCPAQVAPGRAARDRRRRGRRAARRPRRPTASLVLPAHERAVDRAPSSREADRLGLRARRRRARRARCATVAAPRAATCPTSWRQRPRARRAARCARDRRARSRRRAPPAPTSRWSAASGPTVARACSATRDARARGGRARSRARASPEPRRPARRRGPRRMKPVPLIVAAALAAFLVWRRRKLEPTLDRRRVVVAALPSTAPGVVHPPSLEHADQGRRRGARASGPTCSSARWRSSRPARSSA